MSPRTEENREEGGKTPPGRRPLWKRIPGLVWAVVGGVGMVLGILAALNSLGWWPFEDRDLPDVRIDAEASRFNPEGDEASGEYVCLVNAGDEVVQLARWELRDSRDNVVTLGAFRLRPDATVRVHTGNGKRSSGGDLHGGLGGPVWDNDGDEVKLLDAEGREVDSQSYGARDEPDGDRPCVADA